MNCYPMHSVPRTTNVFKASYLLLNLSYIGVNFKLKSRNLTCISDYLSVAGKYIIRAYILKRNSTHKNAVIRCRLSSHCRSY